MAKQDLMIAIARSHLLISTVSNSRVLIVDYLPAVNISKDFWLIDSGNKFYHWVALAVAMNRTWELLHV